jgi:hypothetical protein
VAALVIATFHMRDERKQRIAERVAPAACFLNVPARIASSAASPVACRSLRSGGDVRSPERHDIGSCLVQRALAATLHCDPFPISGLS